MLACLLAMSSGVTFSNGITLDSTSALSPPSTACAGLPTLLRMLTELLGLSAAGHASYGGGRLHFADTGELTRSWQWCRIPDVLFP